MPQEDKATMQQNIIRNVASVSGSGLEMVSELDKSADISTSQYVKGSLVEGSINLISLLLISGFATTGMIFLVPLLGMTGGIAAATTGTLLFGAMVTTGAQMTGEKATRGSHEQKDKEGKNEWDKLAEVVAQNKNVSKWHNLTIDEKKEKINEEKKIIEEESLKRHKGYSEFFKRSGRTFLASIGKFIALGATVGVILLLASPGFLPSLFTSIGITGIANTLTVGAASTFCGAFIGSIVNGGISSLAHSINSYSIEKGWITARKTPEVLLQEAKEKYINQSLEQLRTDNHDLQKERDVIKQKNQDLQDVLNIKINEIKDLTDENQEQQNKIIDKSHEITKQQEEMLLMKQKIEEMAKKMEEIQHKTNLLTDQLKAKNQEIQNKDDRILSLKKENQNLKEANFTKSESVKTNLQIKDDSHLNRHSHHVEDLRKESQRSTSIGKGRNSHL